MRAVVLTGHGGLDKLEFHESWPVPSAGPGEVLIEVGACGMNNTDINTRTGWYASSVEVGTTAEGGVAGFDKADDDSGDWGGAGINFPRIQGADVCGRVVALGDGVAGDLMGKRVLIDTWLRDWSDPRNLEATGYFGSECDGGFAEYTTAPSRNVHPIDSQHSDAELATFATSYVTAENMLHMSGVDAGETVLIPGASGGVGSALIQLVRRRGARPIAMCSESKADDVRAIGAEAVLPRTPDDLGRDLKSAMGSSQVDVVADVVGGPLWPQIIGVLRRAGRYVCSGAIAGPIVKFDLRPFYLNNLTFLGATIVPPDLFARLVGYIERGEIKPLLARTWPLEDLQAAQEAFLAKKHVGNFAVLPKPDR
ncbi:MAG: zinc-binding dehydrogenase [Alphaproteobacteria bacterium]|nr:zinc-binding dehydrogenase [Alphaproteobacteria bacterium]